MSIRSSCAIAILVMGFLHGCQHGETPTVPAGTAPEARGPEFDASHSGTIRGRVTWDGAVPEVPDYTVPPLQFGLAGPRERLRWPHPHAPRVAPGGGVGNAVVFLRGVDPTRARPWDLPPAGIEMSGFQFQVRQGDEASPYGFVHAGAAVRMVSREKHFHSLHADGAAFFTVPFADAEKPATRVLGKRGLVEVTSAANYFWMRAYLWVDDHPYYCRTDAEGRFELTGVPSGSHELVCWVPSWVAERQERDPESCIVRRLVFKPPVEQVRGVHVKRGAVSEESFTVKAAMFGE